MGGRDQANGKDAGGQKADPQSFIKDRPNRQDRHGAPTSLSVNIFAVKSPASPLKAKVRNSPPRKRAFLTGRFWPTSVLGDYDLAVGQVIPDGLTALRSIADGCGQCRYAGGRLQPDARNAELAAERRSFNRNSQAGQGHMRSVDLAALASYPGMSYQRITTWDRLP